MHADVHGIEKDPERAFPLFTITPLMPFNLAIATKDPSSIVDKESALTNQAKAAWKTKVEDGSPTSCLRGLNAMLSTRPALRSDARDKPINKRFRRKPKR
jgi:hypothetical protein